VTLSIMCFCTMAETIEMLFTPMEQCITRGSKSCHVNGPFSTRNHGNSEWWNNGLTLIFAQYTDRKLLPLLYLGVVHVEIQICISAKCLIKKQTFHKKDVKYVSQSHTLASTLWKHCKRSGCK